MRIVDIITKKRGNSLAPQGQSNTKEEIKALIEGYVAGTVPEYQVASWLMAVYFNGMTFEETSTLTEIMLNSGKRINLDNLTKKDGTLVKGPFVDKHSTGGVGDKISLPLAPIVASCGVAVPMMSGRALGHTGGTLDKLESIQNYRVQLNQEEFRRIIAECGFAMTGQTTEIVPADRKLYALRDVTGTVESIPLITASILSKKIAEGSDCLVLDVKYGSGAFMKTKDDAEKLATCMVNTLDAMNKKSVALLTNMNTPLGKKIGNFLEIEETIDCLKGSGPDDVMNLTYKLGAWMCVLAGRAKDEEEGIMLCKNAVTSGDALKLFLQNIDLQGGDSKLVLKEYGVRRSPHKQILRAKKAGYVYIEAYQVGIAGCYLGIGRNKADDAVCADAGIILHACSGDYVQKDDIIMEVYGKDEDCFNGAMPLLEKAVAITDEKSALVDEPLIYKIITSDN